MSLMMIFSGSCFSVVFLFRSCHRTGASDDGFHDGRTIIGLGCQFRFWTSNGKSTWKLNVSYLTWWLLLWAQPFGYSVWHFLLWGPPAEAVSGPGNRFIDCYSWIITCDYRYWKHGIPLTYSCTSSWKWKFPPWCLAFFSFLFFRGQCMVVLVKFKWFHGPGGKLGPSFNCCSMKVI